MGREGGREGGDIVFAGLPEKLIGCTDSYTGLFLKPELKQ
jgi:excinuclease ABC subunit A